MKKIQVKPGSKNANLRLDHFLSEAITEKTGEVLSRRRAKALIEKGAVWLNGKRVRVSSKIVFENARVEVYLDEVKKEENDFEGFPSSKDILYEDDCLIFVNKPAGLPTQGTRDEGRTHLFKRVQKFLADRDSRPNAYLGLHHRLDALTSGIVLFTKEPSINSAITDLFKSRQIKKTYLAICGAIEEVEVSAPWRVKNYLAKKTKKGHSVKSGGDLAITDFEVIEHLSQKFYFIEAKPETGRTHQIRIHLSEAGLPIAGDRLYGGASFNRMYLHASRLELVHPLNQKPLKIEAPLPKEFSEALKKLR